MLKKILLISIVYFAVFSSDSYSQEQEFELRKTTKYLNWSLLQLIPSPILVSDVNEDNARVQFGFQWQIIPLNYSFRANRFVSPFQFFMINPVRRFSGWRNYSFSPKFHYRILKIRDLIILQSARAEGLLYQYRNLARTFLPL